MADIKKIKESELKKLPVFKYDSLIIQTKFKLNDLSNSDRISINDRIIKETKNLIKESIPYLKDGGLLFIYGVPRLLPFYGEYLTFNIFDKSHLLFKYWIALEFKPQNLNQPLPNNHLGILMYLKTASLKNTTPFFLNTKEVRIPYQQCPSCGKITKDWGGKKHLMNPLGSSLSDVWSDLSYNKKLTVSIPDFYLDRISDLHTQKDKILLIEQKSINNNKIEKNYTLKKEIKQGQIKEFKYTNTVLLRDCIEFMDEVSKDFPDGIFDLCFADPPYNLSKNYNEYKDELSDKEYINWCNSWLEGMLKLLKPGGSLFVLNIPKWAIHHATFLSKHSEFRHWIVWDALSTPAGKFLPSHYSLLYFSKPGGLPHKIKETHIPHRKYCLNNICLKKRMSNGDNDTELLGEIWKDVHRIKHIKDRDHHPCQLPTKLMDRIIDLFTQEGDLIFDPFSGAGTTAITAIMKKRNFVVTDLDEYYVKVTKENLKRIESDMWGEMIYVRDSIKRKTNSFKVPRKILEVNYLDICEKHKRVLTLDELKTLDIELHNSLLNYSGDFKKLMNFAKRKMETLFFIK